MILKGAEDPLPFLPTSQAATGPDSPEPSTCSLVLTSWSSCFSTEQVSISLWLWEAKGVEIHLHAFSTPKFSIQIFRCLLEVSVFETKSSKLAKMPLSTPPAFSRYLRGWGWDFWILRFVPGSGRKSDHRKKTQSEYHDPHWPLLPRLLRHLLFCFFFVSSCPDWVEVLWDWTQSNG